MKFTILSLLLILVIAFMASAKIAPDKGKMKSESFSAQVDGTIVAVQATESGDALVLDGFTWLKLDTFKLSTPNIENAVTGAGYLTAVLNTKGRVDRSALKVV